MPNGVKDRIIRKNVQWIIERNCAEITFNGDEDWIKTGVGCSDAITTFTYEFNPKHLKSLQVWGEEQLDRAISDKFNIIGDELYDYTGAVTNEGITQGHLNTVSTDRWYIGISNSKISSTEISSFKQWLSQNSVTVIYQLTTPIYESLNIDSNIYLYTDITHISTNSLIPANLKVTIDRVLNRAVEAIRIAKINPTVENLSLARMWINSAKETIKKDELQNEINKITNVAGLNNISKKDISSNVDVYLKPKKLTFYELVNKLYSI